MTLDIQKLFKNAIEKQSKVSHFECKVKATKTDKVPESVKSLITSQYGNKYLNDADYVAFFWGNITKDNVSKLFKVVDSALGGSANKMTETDFKMIKMDDSSDVEDDSSEETPDEEDTSTEDTSSDEVLDDSGEEDVDLDKEIDDVINEDDDISNDEEPVVNNKFFLKITIK